MGCNILIGTFMLCLTAKTEVSRKQFRPNLNTSFMVQCYLSKMLLSGSFLVNANTTLNEARRFGGVWWWWWWVVLLTHNQDIII